MKTMLIIETTQGREKLLRAAEDSLAEGEAVVKITDTISVESSTLTVPVDPNAEIIAREMPKVLPGGVTALISYVRVKGVAANGSPSFKGIEHRMERTQVVASREVVLKAERIGRRPQSAPA